MAALQLGNLTGDTLQAFSQYMSFNAQALSNAAALFIEDLVAMRSIDFSSVGNVDTLNYLQWDYNTEVQQLVAMRPGSITITDPTSDIDRIGALATPVSPDLASVTPAVPTLDAERPVVSLPARPDADVGDAPSDAPAITDVAAPDAPLITLPSVPTFEELQIPAAPTYTMPSFAAQAPADTLLAPTAVFSFVDTGYTSDLRDPLVAKLLYDLENGGYGIDTADEQALWVRARDRAEATARLAIEEAMKRAAATSFPMPTGALNADIQRARAALMQTVNDTNREIFVKRADMFVENRKFTIEQVQAYEKMDRELYNAIQERALNVAKVTVELGVAVFDATVRKFAASLDAYKTEASVFETRVRAELAKAEQFKAQIEAESLRGQFNAQRVALYQAQLNGVQTVANLYKTRVEAMAALTAAQGQKIEIFKSRVQAYGERVRAKASEFEMYRSAVLGETSKLEIYRTDIAAFEARMRAEELRARTLTMGNDALLSRFKAAVQQYEAQLKGLSATVDAKLEHEARLVAAAGVNVASYRAVADAVVAGIAARKDGQRMTNEWNIATLNSRVEAVKMRLEEMKVTVLSRTEIDKFGSKFFGDPLTATLASLSGLSVKTAE